MTMAWHRRWKLSLDLLSLEAIVTTVSRVKSASPEASLEYPGTELAPPSFLLVGPSQERSRPQSLVLVTILCSPLGYLTQSYKCNLDAYY